MDTGTTYLVLNQSLIPLGKEFVRVVGATGRQEKAFFLKPSKGFRSNVCRYVFHFKKPPAVAEGMRN